MAKKKTSVGKPKLEPSYSPKPARPAKQSLTALDATGPSPSPSFSPDPGTQSPMKTAPKA